MSDLITVTITEEAITAVVDNAVLTTHTKEFANFTAYGNVTQTNVTNTTAWFPITISGGYTSTGGSLFTTESNGRITYNGSDEGRLFLISASAVATCSHGNHTIQFGIGINGDPDGFGSTAVTLAGANKPIQVCKTRLIYLYQGEVIRLYVKGVESAELYSFTNIDFVITEA